MKCAALLLFAFVVSVEMRVLQLPRAIEIYLLSYECRNRNFLPVQVFY